MEESKPNIGLFFISLSLLFFAGVLTFLSYKRYSSIDRVLPEGSQVGEISVSGLHPEEAAERITAIYEQPVILHYAEKTIGFMPETGNIDKEQLLRELQAAVNETYAKNNFMTYLLGKYHPEAVRLEIPFRSQTDAIRTFLKDEVAPRYDVPALPVQPDPETGLFREGHSGCALDTEAAVPLVEAALRSADNRDVELPVNDIPQPEGSLANLEVLLKSVMDTWQDEGQITEVFLSDPKTGQTFDIARKDKSDIPPEVSFTAASTMKLPIMISSYARMDEEPNAFTKKTLSLMITESKNDQTDWMMENVIGGETAPLTVTEDLKKLGLKNSFLAGYFYLGAPLLALVETEANSRTDINLNPDAYNQTTAKDMGTLMDALYRCEQDGSGLLTETFPGKITQEECRAMTELLANNHLPYLISAGVPDSIRVAHKHGWIEENDGLLHTMGNIGIVYSPNRDYILSIYTWHPENLIFEEGNLLFMHISSAIYNYFNP